MAVYTDLTDAEREAVFAAFALGPVHAFKGIAEGIENSNFLVDAAQGRFILTIFERRVAHADLPFFMGVIEHLARAGFPAPRPLPARDGGFLASVRGKPCAVVTFLDGVSPKSPSVAQCAAIGAALARMHDALTDFAGARANALGPQGWADLIRPRLGSVDRLQPGLAAEIEADLAHALGHWPSDLPRGVIHADLFCDNALFVGDELGGVIDFYFACTDFFAYDIACCLNDWCFDERRAYDIAKGRALISSYESVRSLTDAERDALPVLARGAALRFFATRLADWDATPPGALVRPKDPLEYADKLAFHRRARAAEDYGA